MKTSIFGSIIVASLLLSGCGSDDAQAPVVSYVDKVSTSGAALPHSVLLNVGTTAAPIEIRNGGYGSATTAHPTNINQFYAMTDRGPNAKYTGSEGKGKIFPTPEYTPRIGLFEVASDGSIKKIKDILFKDTEGNNISGLPNSSNLGGTGEVPYNMDTTVIRDVNGNIAYDDFGLDSEGLVALKDGSFWVSDEYGPHMVHFNSEGKEIGRINAFVNDTRTQFNLPAEFINRRANRGMEGLAITPDEKTLVGIMQSTMYNPSSAVKTLDITRIVSINIETGATSQYLYKQEVAAHSNSEIVALSATEFLVIERDGAFVSTTPDAKKEIYKIDLSNATDLESIPTAGNLVQDNALGLMINGMTLEEVVLADGNWDTLSAYGISPVSKTLVVDMIAEVNYPHEKMEGIWLINSTTLGIINDDDFATSATGGVIETKYLDEANTVIDASTLYVVDGLNF